MADLVNFNTAFGLSGLKNQQYFRKLVAQGKVPSAQKNENGHWRFDPDAIQGWAANRPRGGGGGDGKRYFRIARRLTEDQAEQVNEVLSQVDLGIEPASAQARKQAAGTESAGTASRQPAKRR